MKKILQKNNFKYQNQIRYVVFKNREAGWLQC